MGNDAQLVLDLDTSGPPRHGGRRRGSGRKLAPGKRRGVPPRPREEHGGRHPVHVTMRAVRGLPSLRSERVQNLLLRAMAAQARRLERFRVVHFSIQRDHLHLIVEAGVPEKVGGKSLSSTRATPQCASPKQLVLTAMAAEVAARSATRAEDVSSRGRHCASVAGGSSPEETLRSGLIGLATALAKRLNRMLGRRGRLWDGRHHRRDLESPTAVRRALVYVLQNHVHHGLATRGSLDRFSSASSLPVWTVGAASHASALPASRRPQSWLLATGWRCAGGLLRPDEAPS